MQKLLVFLFLTFIALAYVNGVKGRFDGFENSFVEFEDDGDDLDDDDDNDEFIAADDDDDDEDDDDDDEDNGDEDEEDDDDDDDDADADSPPIKKTWYRYNKCKSVCMEEYRELEKNDDIMIKATAGRVTRSCLDKCEEVKPKPGKNAEVDENGNRLNPRPVNFFKDKLGNF